MFDLSHPEYDNLKKYPTVNSLLQQVVALKEERTQLMKDFKEQKRKHVSHSHSISRSFSESKRESFSVHSSEEEKEEEREE